MYKHHDLDVTQRHIDQCNTEVRPFDILDVKLMFNEYTRYENEKKGERC